jgi:hypothetical protein
LPWIIRDFVRSKVLQIQYRSLETDTLTQKVFLKQQAAALAAGEQDRMWNFIETFYHEQGQEYTPYVTAHYLDGIAGQVPNLDLSRWGRERNNAALLRQPAIEDGKARLQGFHDTPSFLIGRTGGPMTKLLGYQITKMSSLNRRLRFPESLVDVTLLTSPGNSHSSVRLD